MIRSERKTNNRDFLTKDSTKKTYLLTKYDDIVYNPSNLKYGAIDRNKYGKGVISPIYVTFETNQIPSFIELIVTSKNFQQRALKYEEGTVIKRQSVKPEYLLRLNINVPELKEQQKIAAFLSSVDEKLQQLTKKKSLLEDYKKGVMQKIFSQELRFKDDNGNNYPDWEEKKLGEVLVEVNQKTTISNEYEILSSTMKGIFKQGDYFKRDIASKDNTGYKILRKNQLVFSPQNLWLGNINLNLTYDIGIVSPSYKIFSFSKDVELSYFKDLLKTPKMLHEYIQASEQGASVVRRNLDMSSFNAIKLNLPCLEEQQKIANFLSAIDEKISLTNIQIDNTKVFKKGLLQQMFV